MEFVDTPEQTELRDSLRRFLAERSPESAVRALMETDQGYDPAVWSQLTDQLGVTGLAIPEEYGGSGFSFLEVAIVLQEMGRVLLCAPFLSSLLASTALLGADDGPAKHELLPRIAEGALACLAYVESPHEWAGGTGTTARATPDGLVLDGTKSFVIDGLVAEVLVVLATGADGPGLYAVDGNAPGLTRTALPTMDGTRKLARLEFAGTPARCVASPAATPAALARTLDTAAAALAAEQVGGAERVLDMSVEYATLRVQFGRPIGGFQAIKHKCVDMYLAVESARAAAAHAAWAVVEDPDELPVAACIAQSHCSEAYAAASAANIQVHGGIGFTWEHPAQLYFKRATASALLLGDATYHRALLARRLGLAAA